MKKITVSLITIVILTLINTAYSLEYKIENYYYPTTQDAIKIKKYTHAVSLQVCCEFPTINEGLILKDLNLKHLIIKASHFPSKKQVEILESVSVSYSIILDEVFPSRQDLNILNNSKVSLLTMFSRDFPTMGEVQAFNHLKIPFRFNITHKEYPLPRHMKIIKLFKREFTVAFYNKALPGPGYANFFNDLKTKKTFVAIEQFPWGDDAIGVNLLTNSSIEIMPSEPLMPQDIAILNDFQILPTIFLTESYPIDERLFNLIKKLNTNKIILNDSGTGELLTDYYANMATSTKQNIVFKFFNYH